MNPAAAATSAAAGWRWRHVLLAPHRLAFLLATLVLVAAALWWTLALLDRAGVGPGLAWELSPSLVHAGVMTFGFMPLFFAGFLFTAGPRWLGVTGPSARQLAPALLAQAGGWLLWLVGSHLHRALAAAALVLALFGLGAVTLRFWRLVGASRMPDRLHPKLAGAALLVGCLSLAGMAGAVAADADGVARAFALGGLWGFVVAVYLTVSHRMLPFLGTLRWVLWLLLGAAGTEALAAGVDAADWTAPAWTLLRGLLALGAGSWVLWLAVAWSRQQRGRTRLLALLHIGFLWLGAGFALSGVSQLAELFAGAPVLPLAALHAVTLGGLGSLMLAMVTRVTCAHSGRAVVVDDRVWMLFWLLQLATALRLAAAVPALPGAGLLLAAAGLWAGLVGTWGVRHGYWYGCLRADARPG